MGGGVAFGQYNTGIQLLSAPAMLGFGISFFLQHTWEGRIFTGFFFLLSLFVFLIFGHGLIYPALLIDFLIEEWKKARRKTSPPDT